MPSLDPTTPILVVDDSEAIRRLTEAYLRRLGYLDVRLAGTVEEGLLVFREQQSEVVLVDMVLEDKEIGADFIRKALAERPFVTVVVMSALPATHDLVTLAISEGAREYLQKPVRLPALREVLARVAREREGEQQGREDATYA